MFAFIKSRGAIPEDEAVWYFRQIMRAMEYCHSFNICHRDLKPENILVTREGIIKIADFGMAALQQDGGRQLRTACGSPHYAAPEVLNHKFYRGSAIDIWSMGVILFAMLAARLPFDEPNHVDMMAKARVADYIMPSHFSKYAKDLIRRILTVDPHNRITMAQMWEHPLIKSYNYLDDHLPEVGPTDLNRGMSVCPIPTNEIDPQLLRQLKSMWYAYDERQLARLLTSERFVFSPTEQNTDHAS
jgi:serine/threonine-protein kinase HSL1, negative regulator of Swe1 kinase